jgi:short-subunit dehydrogenase
MIELSGKTYWLIGASEGLGRALAHELSSAGVRLILSARNAERLNELANDLPGSTTVIPIDVSNADSVTSACQQIPKLDGVIYSAGIYEPMSATSWQANVAEAMLDINLLGAFRTLSHIIPKMDTNNGGHIVLIGSLSGLIGLPGSIGYSSSKAGLIHLAECLKTDLDPKKFTIQIINPGFIKSRLTDKNKFPMPFIMSAKDAAKRTMKIMRSGKFRSSFPRRFALIFYIATHLPDWLYFRTIRGKTL